MTLYTDIYKSGPATIAPTPTCADFILEHFRNAYPYICSYVTETTIAYPARKCIVEQMHEQAKEIIERECLPLTIERIGNSSLRIVYDNNY